MNNTDYSSGKKYADIANALSKEADDRILLSAEEFVHRNSLNAMSGLCRVASTTEALYDASQIVSGAISGWKTGNYNEL